MEEYIKSERSLKKTRRKLEEAIAKKMPHNKIGDALDAYDAAVQAKQRAVRNIKSEYLFLNCERDIKPPIDGIYVMKELIKQCLCDLDEEDYFDLMASLEQKRVKQK